MSELLSKDKLAKLVSIIKSHVPTEKIILYGSAARGERVSDRYVEDNVTYSYESDIDLFVVVASSKLRDDANLWFAVRNSLKEELPADIPLSLLVETADTVKKKLLEHNYFYIDIIREGSVLYDSGHISFVSDNVLTAKEQKAIALREYEFWMSKANDFLIDYDHNMADELYNNASFHLSQVTEALYFAVLLTFTGYKPKSHNLEKIEDLISTFLPDIKSVFPRDAAKDIELFDLLSRAYIDARYKKDYVVSRSQLMQIHKNILLLKDYVKEKCEKKLASF